MKYNNKLNLNDYFQVIHDIVDEYFDKDTFEYAPQFGEAFALCAYFNNCVELEDSDTIKTHPIDNILEVQHLYDDEDFMNHFMDEVACVNNIVPSLTFGNAYNKAMDIVEFKKNDANSYATAISASIDAVLKSFRETFSESDIRKFAEIAQQIKDGKLSEEAIVEAYGNSDRFKANTALLNEGNATIALPPQT